jgi:hypothetical protein
MQGGRGVSVDSELLGRHREYLFRKTFGGSHKDYLDETLEDVQWMLLIAGKEAEAEAEIAEKLKKKGKRRS